MKVVAYRRVSTDGQASDGQGLEIQGETIRKWATTNGHRIASWQEDVKSGATELDDRLGLALAIDALKSKRARGIVVARLDRLARDLVLQETLLAEVKRHGARVFSCAPSEDAYLEDDPSDPSRKLIRGILGAVAEYERAMIRLRLEAGIARKRAEGGYWAGAPPYGWKAEGGMLVREDAAQDAIKIMQTMRAGGAGYRKIALLMEQSGAPAPKGGGRWHANSVRRILMRSEDAA